MTDPMNNLAQAVKCSIKIHDLKIELDSIPVKVREVEESLQAITSQYEEKKAAQDKMENERRQLESELQTETERLKQKEERLNTIKTQKEYQAVVSEITTAKTSNREREDKILQFLSELETFATDLGPLKETLTELETRLEQEKSEISGTLNELDTKIVALQKQLAEQLFALPDDIRNKYERIEQQKQPPAALVVGGTCQACFLAIPPQLFIEIQKGHQVHSCPNCLRLLFLEVD